MHGRDLWLLAGTGEGPVLAAALLERGWSVLVSVVEEAALRAYAPHPRLGLRSGALAGPAGIRAELEAAAARQRPFRWVVDASHPFAGRISADLAAVCHSRGQELLRLWRPPLPPAPGGLLQRLTALEDLAALDLSRERLLLAIGARQLAAALVHAAAGASFARVLPSPLSLQQARAAGLSDAHLACHRPGSGDFGREGRSAWALECALLRRWEISAVLCRQSGGETERCWQTLCGEARLRLLLLARPAEPEGVTALPLAALLEKLDRPDPHPDATGS